MRKGFKKLLAGVLAAGMLIGAAPVQTFGAEENAADELNVATEEQSAEKPTAEDQTVQDRTEVSEDAESTESAEVDQSETAEQTPEDLTEESQQTEEEQQAADSLETEEKNESADVDQAEDEVVNDSFDAQVGEVNFVYVESPYLETPDTQRIVFMFDEKISGTDEITLEVEDSAGNTEEWGLSEQKESLYLFEKEFSGEAYTDTYNAVSLNLYNDSNEQSIELKELGIEVQFGVNREYDGIEELQPISEEAAEDASPVGMSVVTIDENGVSEAQDSIEDALNVVSESMDADSGISTYSADSATSSKARSTGNVVVALDPGHDSRHAGAQANGLKEEVLTLKIANYCKEELEKYAGVSVYMTRTGASCPYPSSGSSGDCISRRAEAAAKAGAQIYVSFHLNSSTSSAAKGAEIIVPNRNWKPEVGKEGEKLAEEIMDELVKIGLSERDIYSKDTTINEKYEDGSLSDYFSVQIYCKENDIPGIIVEHAFISNGSEASKFLKTESGLKKLGVADATGIAQYLGLFKLGDRVTIPEGTYVLESALKSGKVATVKDNSVNNQTPVVLSDNKESSSQRFEITSLGNGYYSIVAEHSGKVMDIKNGSSANGAVIQQYTSNNTSAQKWSFINAGNGYYYIASALGTYMDVKSANTSNGTQIQGYQLNQSSAQKWKLVKSDYRPVADGTYTISSSLNKNIVLDIASASMDNMKNVQVYTSNNTSAQRFEITYVGDGYYSIRAEHSSKALDVEDGSKSNGANVQQYKCYNSKQQLWKFVDAGNGKYYIRSKLGTVIDIAGGKATSGANVQMWTADYGNDQKWTLTKSEYRPVSDGEYVLASSLAQEQVATESGSNIELGTFGNNKTQIFKVSYVSNGYYKIILSSTGKALSVKNGSSANKANVQVGTWNGSDAQLWKFIDAKNSTYYIKSKLGTTLDLPSAKTASGTNIQTYEMNGTGAQKWVLDEGRADLKEVDLEEGTYTIQNTTGSKQVLDVKSRSLGNGANVQTYASNNTPAQRFEVFSAGNGYYKIVAEHSGKVLDIKNGSAASGANVQQYTWNGTDAQLWRFLKDSNGTYYIQSKKGTILDLDRTSAVSTANVQMNSFTGKASQRWKIIKSDYKPVSDGTYYLKVSSSNNHVLDIANASKANGANAQLYTCNGTDAQKFVVTYQGNGYYKIASKHSNKAIEYKTPSANKANVQQNEWTGADNQLWKFIEQTDGSYVIRSKSGLALDVYNGKIQSKSNVQLYQINGTSAQKWQLREIKDYKYVNVEEGIYTVHTALNSGRVLDIYNGLKTNGANVQIYAQNGTEAQKFKVEKASDGYYKIIAKGSGKALDIKSASMMPGANVQQYTWNESAAQLWRFIDAGDGTYYIQSKLGTVLNVADNKAEIKANVDTDILDGSLAQKWVLSQTPLYEIMGGTSVTADQMVKYFESKKVTYPYTDSDAPTIKDFCELYIQECKIEGVRAEVAFCQAMLETGFLKFGGDVDASQYNFAGLGATGGGVAGETFPSVQIGIRAHVQHLKAYASTEPLKQECVDNRFKYVQRGCAKYVQYLGMQENPNSTGTKKVGWAAAKDYGYDMVELYIVPLKKF